MQSHSPASSTTPVDEGEPTSAQEASSSMLRKPIGFGNQRSGFGFFDTATSPFAQAVSRSRTASRGASSADLPMDADSDTEPSPALDSENGSPNMHATKLQRQQPPIMVSHSPDSPDGAEEEPMVDELASPEAMPPQSAHGLSRMNDDRNSMDVEEPMGDMRSRSSSAAGSDPQLDSSGNSADKNGNGSTKRGRASRKHFNDRFSEKTSKFRLTGYVNDPNASAGASASPEKPNGAPGAVPDTGFMVQNVNSMGSSSRSSRPPNSNSNPIHVPPSREPAVFEAYDPHAPTQRRRRQGRDGGNEQGSQMHPPFTYDPAVHRNVPPGHGPGLYDALEPRGDWSHHPPMPPTHGGYPSGETHRANAYIAQVGGGPPPPPYPAYPSHQYQSSSSNGSARGANPSGPRVVNVLIKDLRGDGDEDQYAEVRIPLRAAGDEGSGPTQGYWADTNALVDALQSGPGRIDGPAKVYTMRGKYKQFFLRISEKNEDQCTPANMLVSPKRVLDIFVTHLVPPPSTSRAARPRPEPEMPSRSPPASPPSGPTYTYPPPVPPPNMRRPPTYDTQPSGSALRKRPRAPDNDSWDMSPSSYYDEMDDIPPSVSPERRYNEQSQPPPRPNSASKRQRTTDDYYGGRYPPPPNSSHSTSSRAGGPYPASPPAPIPARVPPPQIQVPHHPDQPPSPPEPALRRGGRSATVDDVILKYVKDRISMDPEYDAFVKSQKAPAAVPEILRQFKFVSRQIAMYGSTRTPASVAGAPQRDITEAHVLEALYLPPKYGHEANTILGLWRLYGKRGEYVEDPEVVKLGTAEFVPGQRLSGNEMHEFVKLLAATDSRWMREHPEAVLRKPGAVRSGEGALPAAPPMHEPVGKLSWKGISGSNTNAGKPSKAKERI